MREMKDSGIEWIGELSENWRLSKIKYVADIFGRIGFRGYTQQDLVGIDEGAITLSPSNFSDMKMNYKKCSYISWKKYEESPEIMIFDGDILFVKTGSTYGKSVRVIGLPQKATINPQLLVFKKIIIDEQFFLYFLQTSLIRYQTELAVVGGTIPTISQEKIGNFLLIVPPLPEQQLIAAYLDRKCAEIDTLVADIETQIETLEQYKRSVITEAVTKGLSPDAEMKDSGIEWIGTIPKHWNAVKLKYIAKEEKENGFFDPNADKYIGLENVKSYSNDLVETSTMYEYSMQSVCHKGDVMFGKLRPYLAKVIIVPFDGFCTGEFLQFSYFTGNKEFLRYSLLNEKFIELLNSSTYGSKMPRVSTEFILNTCIPYPPVEEQHAIAKYLNRKCSEIDSIIADKQAQLDTLAEYKKSLIYEYVTGKKEVPVNA